ncbi:MAG: CBS domain-containing protein [Proteobacteria bacterium]|nr:CBS domain-containing protein [Pseudomonadota bacterium]MDA1327167.1 CBS domain-containing protein [Pseudomonadota bacterium]
MLAKDVMTTEVVTVSPDTPVSEIAQLLLSHCISAVPVIGEKGNVAGIVSEGDLMRRPESDTDLRARSWWLMMMTDAQRLAGEYNKTHGQRASDVMTKNVVVVDEDTPVTEIAQILEEKHVKRVPVVHNGNLVGIVSRANLLRGLATAKRTPLSPVSKGDQSLRQDVLAALRKEPWADLTHVNPTVEDGVVHLWGLSESPEERKAYEIAATAVAGVKAVQNNLTSSFPQYYWSE